MTKEIDTEFNLIREDDFNLLFSQFGTIEEFLETVALPELEFAYWATVRAGEKFVGPQIRGFSNKPEWATHVLWGDG